MPITVTGILRNPTGLPVVNSEVRIVSTTSLGDTVATTESHIITDIDGAYDFDLVFGRHSLYLRVCDTYELIGDSIVDESTPTPINLPELLRYTTPVPVPPPEVEDPEWDTLINGLLDASDTLSREDREQIRDGESSTIDLAQLDTNEVLNGAVAQDANIQQIGKTSSTNKSLVYSDANNHSYAGTETTLGSGLNSITAKTTVTSTSRGTEENIFSKLWKTTTSTFKELLSQGETLNRRTEATTYDSSLIQDTAVGRSIVTSKEYTVNDIHLRNTISVTDSISTVLDQKLGDIEAQEITLLNNKYTTYKLATHGSKTASESFELAPLMSRKDFRVDIFEVGRYGDKSGLLEVDTVTGVVSINGQLIINNDDEYKGPAGDTIFEVYQYSILNSGPWLDNFFTSARWRRMNQSINGVVNSSTWSEPMLFVGTDGSNGDTNYWEYQYANETDAWHDAPMVDGDVWRRERLHDNGNIGAWTPRSRIRGVDGQAGEIVDIEYQYSINGLDLWHSNFVTGDHYRRERTRVRHGLEDPTPTYTPWSTATKIVPEKGDDYFDGLNQASIFIYKRGDTTPNTPTKELTYNFTNHMISGELEGWEISIPSGSNNIYIASATAVSMKDTDTISPSEWSVGLLASNGHDGIDAMITRACYFIGSTAPTQPTGNTLPPTGWTQDTPVVLPTGESAYVAYTYATDDTVTTGSGFWTSVGIWRVPNPSDGVDGKSSIPVYKNSKTIPTKPTGTVIPPSGWEEILPPPVEGATTWISYTLASIAGVSDGNWSEPRRFLEPPKYNVATMTVFKESVATPNTPDKTTSYSFITDILTGDLTGWSRAVPSNTTNAVWATSAPLHTLTETDNIDPDDWSDPIQWTGADGYQAATVTLYKVSSTRPKEPDNSITYNFSNGKITGSLDGWSNTLIEDTGGKVWITQAMATAKAPSVTDDITPSEWTNPKLLVQDGLAGSTIYRIYQHSQDNSSWHSDFLAGDKYQRFATVTNGVTGTWSKGYLIVGVNGDTGIQGPAGSDGVNSYFHVAYSNSADGSGLVFAYNNHIYMGTYTDSIKANSTDKTKYTWFKSLGFDGAQGIPGIDGETGKTSYLHIAYADDSNGKNFTTGARGDRKWIGTYVDFIEDDSTSHSKYSWAKFIGEDGTNGVDGFDGKDGSWVSYIYKTGVAKPTVPTGGTFNGSTETFPSGWRDDPYYTHRETTWVSSNRYVQQADKSWKLKGSWSSPSEYSKQGESGIDGYNQATVQIYQRKGSKPNNPSATCTYNFKTKALTGLNNDWKVTPPAFSKDDLYVAIGSFASQSQTDTIAGNEWSSAILASNGADGFQSSTITIYQSKATKPTLPTISVVFDFPTGKLVTEPNNGWKLTPPSNIHDRMWFTIATAASLATNSRDTIEASEWANPEVLATGGADGKVIKDVFKLSSGVPSRPTGSTIPPNGWTNEPPNSIPDGQRVWIAYTYADTPNSITGSGQWSNPAQWSGNNGIDGMIVRGVYRLSVSKPSKPSGNKIPPSQWSESVPDYSKDKGVIWACYTYAENDSTPTGSGHWSSVGQWSGAHGLDGDRGIQGLPGADGKPTYFHIAYADDANGGGFSQNPANKRFMGTYADSDVMDSTDPKKYAWVLIKGANGSDGTNGHDGKPGTNGIPGTNGANGQTSYLHIAYADTVTGSGFSQDPIGKKYIGQYVDFTQADSPTPSKYKWSLMKGADGMQSATVSVYKLSASKPEKSTLDIVYIFATGKLNQEPNKGWSSTVPTNTVAGGKLWISSATALTSAVNATDTIAASEFSDPVQFSGNGNNGSDGEEGSNGTNGSNGSGFYTIFKYKGTWPSDSTGTQEFITHTGRSPQEDDHLTYATLANEIPKRASTKRYNGSAWVAPAQIINGDLLVQGTVTADRVTVNELSAFTANMGTLTAGTVTGATVRTASSGNRVQMDKSNKPFFIGDGTNNKLEYTKSNNTLTFKGDLDIKSSTSGGRLEITNKYIRVYDTSNRLRVEIGEL